MEYSEYKRRRLRADERLAIMQLDMLSRSLDGCIEDLARVLGDYKPLKRNQGMYRYIVRDIIDTACRDAPPDTLDVIRRQGRDYRMGLDRVSPVRKTEEMVMPLEDEWQFIHITLDARCGMCMKTPAECNACKVRQLLRKYADEPEPGTLGCGYKGAGLGNSKKLNKQVGL